ncbi:MAG: LURP-one-related family protein [Clostridiales bacterium]|jgi:uncharacterized protein YxjI|nr:LURP-one-related family protein [Clostridiales bacterium]
MYLYLKQKVFSLTEKFTFFDENQNVVYSAGGSFFSFPKTFRLLKDDRTVLTIEKKIWPLMPQYRLLSADGNEIAFIKQKFTLKPTFEIASQNGNLRIDGSFWGYTFRISDADGNAVTSVQKRYFSWGDAYEIYIDESKINPAAACGIVVAFDNAVHNENNGN